MKLTYLICSLVIILQQPDALSQVIYKCGNTFSDTKCASDANIVFKSEAEKAREANEKRQKDRAEEIKIASEILAKRKANLPSRTWGAEKIDRLQEACKIRPLALLKDPNSAIFSNFTLLPEPTPYYPEGSDVLSKSSSMNVAFAAEILFFINAKNSYGGYTGDKLWKCLVDWETGTKIISTSSIEK